MPKHPKVSIIIPSLGRGEVLAKCLESIKAQTFADYEVILETEEGPLAKIRNQATKKAQGQYLVFIDDDTVQTKTWLESIVRAFENGAFGVSGPSIIPDSHRKQRDLFRWKKVKSLYDSFFCEGKEDLP